MAHQNIKIKESSEWNRKINTQKNLILFFPRIFLLQKENKINDVRQYYIKRLRVFKHSPNTMNQVNEKKTEKKTTKIHNQIIYSLLVDSDSLRIFKNLTKQRSNENEEEFLGDCCCCIEQWPGSEYTKTRARTQYRTLSAVYFRSTWFWFDLIQISIEKWNRNKKKF